MCQLVGDQLKLVPEAIAYLSPWSKPLPIVLKQIESQLREMGDRSSDLLEKYFAQSKD